MNLYEGSGATTRAVGSILLSVGIMVLLLAALGSRTSVWVLGASLSAVGLALRFDAALRVDPPPPTPPDSSARTTGAYAIAAGLVAELFGAAGRPVLLLSALVIVLVGIALRLEAAFVERSSR